MKKTLVTLLCTLLVTSLVACNGESNGDTPAPSDTNPVSESTPLDVTLDASSFTNVGTKETVLVDTAEYKLTLSENYSRHTNSDTIGGFYFSMTLENKTNEKVSFLFEDIAVNGKTIPLDEANLNYGTKIDPADSTFGALVLSYDSLSAMGITTIEEVSFVLEVYPVTGAYGELGDLLYTSEKLSFECIADYEGEDVEDEDEEAGSSYTYNEVTVEEQVLLDDAGLKISTTGDITFEEGYAHRIGLLIENKTDGDLSLQTRYVAVNGYSQTTYLWTTVPAGETLETTLNLLYYDLMLCNIDTIATVEFVLEVGVMDPYIYEPIVIETSAAGYEQPNEFEGTTVYNENGIEIIALDCVYDLEHASGPVFYINNQSGSEIDIRLTDVTMNGISVGKEGESRLASGIYHVKLLDYSNDMYDNDIETITDMSFNLTIYDDSFNAIADGETVSITY